jgi:hypothetical protein
VSLKISRSVGKRSDNFINQALFSAISLGCAGPPLGFDVVYVFAYIVALSQQALQWSLGAGRPNFHFDGFFPLLDDVLGLSIKVNVGTKHYREQLFNLLQFSYPALFSRIPPFCIHVLPRLARLVLWLLVQHETQVSASSYNTLFLGGVVRAKA